MSGQSEFHWLSPLGLSVILFLLYGVVYLLIGSLTFFLADSNVGKPMIIMSPRTDEKLFGEKPEKLLAENPSLKTTRSIIVNMLAGMLIACGILVLGITWFGIKSGDKWALILMTIIGIAVLPSWWAAVKPYSDAGIKLTLSDIPPFIWVPAALYLPATILGWIGLK